jgi:hypothetical protein
MGTTSAQRQEIDDMENLTAGIDFVDRLLQRLAEATRHAYTLEQLADGRQRLEEMRQIAIRRRQALSQAARTPSSRSSAAPDVPDEDPQAPKGDSPDDSESAPS